MAQEQSLEKQEQQVVRAERQEYTVELAEYAAHRHAAHGTDAGR